MNDLLAKITELRAQFENLLNQADSENSLNNLYLKYFSKTQGEITSLFKEIPSLSLDEKKEFGPLINNFQEELKQRIEDKKVQLANAELDDPMIDLTYPEVPAPTGMLHPTTQVIREMNEFFRYYGFSIVEGPEIENVEFNFRILNLPEGHPATDLQDSLFIRDPDILLRTHTSSIESRVLTNYKPPIRVAFPGKSFRNDTANRTNMSFFHQYQGVVVDKGINIQHLKGTLTLLLQHLFGNDVNIRFRYKYYPEVTPGMGADIRCKFCEGKGCPTCKYRGYIEVLGSGMIHYNTLKMCGIDPEEYTGYAFGMGLDRLVMTKFGIDDIRKLYGEGIIYE